MDSTKAAAATQGADDITLTSTDGDAYRVARVPLMQASLTICNLLEDTDNSESIPLPNVNSSTLAKVIEFCVQYHAASTKSVDDREQYVKRWSTELMHMDQTLLFDIILASNYLNIKVLLDLSCKTVANMIKGRTPEEIRQIFGICNDFTPEEEEDIRRENMWAFAPSGAAGR